MNRSTWAMMALGVVCLISILACSSKKEEQKFDFGDTPTLDIYIDSLDLSQMAQMRERAIEIGVMDDEAKLTFPCVIEYEGRHLSGTIRFKGDWTDHLETGKWSYRIELNDGGMIKGRSTFSIQHPATRGYGQEWLMHRLLDKSGVLSTHYSFVPVRINTKEFGLYAFEEHFEKQLLEDQNRREGVILKFDETSFWLARQLEKLDSTKYYYPEFEAAIVRPFKEKKTLKSNSLFAQLQMGTELCEMYQNFNPDIEQYMDVKRTASYYAWITLGNSTHGMAWHNQRWYMNPVTAKLEPIGFDCYGGPEKSTEKNQVFTSLMGMDRNAPISLAQYFRSFLFTVPAFQAEYLASLEQITTAENLRASLKELEPEIKTTNELLKVEFANWTLDTSYLMENARVIRKSLPEFKEWLKNDLPKVVPDRSNRRANMSETASKGLKVLDFSNGQGQYTLQNYGGMPVTVFAYRLKGSKKKMPLTPTVTLGIDQWKKNQANVQVNGQVADFYFRSGNDTTIRSTSSVHWPAPQGKSLRQGLQENGVSSFKFMVENGSDWVVPQGEHRLDKILFVPKGKRLVFEAGASLTLLDGSGVISESIVSMVGTKQAPIIVRAASAENHGLVVLQAPEKSILKHVEFIGLNTLHYQGWGLTGAVNFYESEVMITHCRFAENICEDGLNIIRSVFEIDSCLIEGAFSDGFDADFCTGVVRNSTFRNIGNDGMDFSGSVITISDCKISGVNDKGISCGERSTVEIKNVSVTGAKIGIAAKDQSQVKAKEIQLTDCQFGFAAYTKKIEYGGASIDVTHIKEVNVKKQSDIEFGSTFILDGKLLKGEKYSSITKY